MCLNKLFTFILYLCTDACQDVVCGPNSYCTRGTCLCEQGMTGQPNNVGIGCSGTYNLFIIHNLLESFIKGSIAIREEKLKLLSILSKNIICLVVTVVLTTYLFII